MFFVMNFLGVAHSQRRLLTSSPLQTKNSTDTSSNDNTFRITLDWYWIFAICLGAAIIVTLLIVICGYFRMLVRYILGRAS